MDWWNDLWLKEGFATWAGWLEVDHFHPGKLGIILSQMRHVDCCQTYRVECLEEVHRTLPGSTSCELNLTFYVAKCEGLQTAFQLDSLRASHAIDVHVENGPDIDEIFDDISYLKGSSLVRTLDSYLGREVFLEGVANYLSTFAYSEC